MDIQAFFNEVTGDPRHAEIMNTDGDCAVIERYENLIFILQDFHKDTKALKEKLRSKEREHKRLRKKNMFGLTSKDYDVYKTFLRHLHTAHAILNHDLSDVMRGTKIMKDSATPHTYGNLYNQAAFKKYILPWETQIKALDYILQETGDTIDLVRGIIRDPRASISRAREERLKRHPFVLEP